jgi:hypothetical protein
LSRCAKAGISGCIGGGTGGGGGGASIGVVIAVAAEGTGARLPLSWVEASGVVAWLGALLNRDGASYKLHVLAECTALLDTTAAVVVDVPPLVPDCFCGCG